MRVAVSGTHSTGKSTLIARFLERLPNYAHEPEAFETLGDDVDIADSGAPTPEGLKSLLEFTVAAVQGQSSQANVVFERSPADYLAYAAASRRAWGASDVDEFIAAYTPVVRSSLRQLDLIAYLPLSGEGATPRPGEGKRFRRQVDLWLRRILLDGEYELFEGGCPPLVGALPTRPAEQLLALCRHVQG